ncbi:hypothetical protein ACFFTM_24175 [Pseudoduganella plicata]|uniref:HPr-rel-A system PqqD family peptide chaperone n=1 Tax=Pseudoduganella plicata TaxID=321984 RepID=A0A4P7BI81_9BURK|nr:hypothetical protein [Pseudoduganella plicata]QBQ37345.1 hypothetical protein E1742_15115 [Pseudoduganella plicata]GGZ09008.1 hypothetical protein GCM10007388_48160 [Pseudoduganella plicata]
MKGWRIVAGQRLRHRCWDSTAVLYNDLSGATHQLSEPALALLLDLRDGLIADAELADPALAELLDNLRHLDLIEAA